MARSGQGERDRAAASLAAEDCGQRVRQPLPGARFESDRGRARRCRGDGSRTARSGGRRPRSCATRPAREPTTRVPPPGAPGIFLRRDRGRSGRVEGRGHRAPVSRTTCSRRLPRRSRPASGPLLGPGSTASSLDVPDRILCFRSRYSRRCPRGNPECAPVVASRVAAAGRPPRADPRRP